MTIVRNLGGWIYYNDPSEVIPIDDLRPHEFGTGCWCKPESWRDWEIAHKAMDDRESYEQGRPLQ